MSTPVRHLTSLSYLHKTEFPHKRFSISHSINIGSNSKDIKFYPGEQGVGTRKAFPESAKQKERISIADDAPEVNTNCDGSKETEFLVASDINPATACHNP